MALNAGDMRWRITIEQLNTPEGVDPDQYPLEEWTPLRTVYAQRLNPRAGEETFEAGGAQVMAIASTVFRIRYRADMDPDRIDIPKRRRLVFDGSTLNIIDARAVDWKTTVELVTREQLT